MELMRAGSTFFSHAVYSRVDDDGSSNPPLMHDIGGHASPISRLLVLFGVLGTPRGVWILACESLEGEARSIYDVLTVPVPTAALE